MRDSLPGRDLERIAASSPYFDNDTLKRYEAVLQRMAVPYRVDRSGKATRGDYPTDRVSTATGLISTALDLARFDSAIDNDELVHGELRAVAWTNVTTSSGAALPSGLGWFVQSYNGERLVWHFGAVRDTSSSLVLKVPGRDITLILLANSDGLSAPYALAEGDVTAFALRQAVPAAVRLDRAPSHRAIDPPPDRGTRGLDAAVSPRPRRRPTSSCRRSSA